ncbi:general transcription factor 3C polypeptide 5 [Trichonephila clavata]|uniref:General transcription factor 3C polypeptide 5 n=1 Tax=Trichonephila clavata TaxID=2740835 RepID=A0A8X6GGP7_TRICU|nr:general transcription factor 3C polypeptide 5 [Trichonephila clavata]
MEIAYNPKPLIAVEYPGTVLNVDNMSKTLGGNQEMFTIFKNSTKRLELKFRPDDPFCKCIHGDRFNTTNLVMKVIKKTKRKSKNCELPPESKPEVKFKIEFLGVANTTYKFKSLADFQILPVSYDNIEGTCKSLLPKLVPTTLHSSSWLEEEIELFVPPILFSRFDLPQSTFSESQNKVKVQECNQNLPPNIIGRGRKRRAGYAVFATFEEPKYSTEPKPEAVNQLKTYPLDIEVKNKVDVLFHERQVWSKNALMLRLKCEKSKLKYPLPCCAFYFTNGPWRTLWVKFGYDPRKDPASKIYQVLDLRINPAIPINEKGYRPRPTYYSLPNKSMPNHQRVATINTSDLIPTSKDDEMDDDKDMHIKLLACEYIPGQLPTARQCFYQLCDIHLDSVQKLVHENDGLEEFCHERDGWCIPGTIEKCRDLIIADLLKTVQELKEAEAQ